MLKENKLSEEGLTSPETSQKLGNLIGIDTLIFGTVTQIGSKSVKLSVRAVAVETGKIVAAQSANLPVTDELSEMLVHGVPSVASDTQASTSSIRDRLRPDTIKLTASELAIPFAFNNTGYGAVLSFSVENRSGVGLGVAVKSDSATAGPCSNSYHLSGLPAMDSWEIDGLMSNPNPASGLYWLSAGTRVTANINFPENDCNGQSLSGLSKVAASMTIVLATNKEVVLLPLNVENVPIRVRQQ